MSERKTCIVLNTGTTEAHVKAVRISLESLDFNFSDIQYAFFKAQSCEHSLVFYRSGKIVIQGKNPDELLVQLKCASDIEFEESVPKPGKSCAVKSEADKDECIGIDESGKGDFFGPLVISAVFVDRKMAGVLREYGVQDSKNISDVQIRKLNSLIISNCPNTTISLGPAKYNQLYESFGNLNKLLAWAHATALEDLLGKVQCEKAISDQFAREELLRYYLKDRGRGIELVQTPKAERFIAVAAASIVARNRFVEGLRKLSENVGIELPKGCGSNVVSVGRNIVGSGREEILSEISKLHFKTSASIRE
ncbi:MAG: ribonuclease HIII [Candidatus Wallbacteria bacterium HGW-Wallbacteria-1]|jgi:ribonuclease HIII|uniref:Ribonuclease n=1 Tax=Candidatus Wallbacteria bacterium HGW-Wallbacteria-1 TaxID=2013854 RepID=A0A2N1PRI3_9BACT|nr:MAG: ribonuclease HIII [Candidatus Wallbacteria bacterium HGW-Wallbacteria-1]